jgi:hypothetical protein
VQDSFLAELPVRWGRGFNRGVPTDTSAVEYGVAPQLRARVMGAYLVLLGLLVCATTVVVSLFQLPLDVMSVLVVLVAVAVLGGGYLLTRRTYVVRADVDGYRVRLVRGAGVRAARWQDVEDVVATHVAGARCVQLRLRNGGTTTIPVDVLAIEGDDFVRELQNRLDHGHGYRRTG